MILVLCFGYDEADYISLPYKPLRHDDVLPLSIGYGDNNTKQTPASR